MMEQRPPHTTGRMALQPIERRHGPEARTRVEILAIPEMRSRSVRAVPFILSSHRVLADLAKGAGLNTIFEDI